MTVQPVPPYSPTGRPRVSRPPPAPGHSHPRPHLACLRDCGLVVAVPDGRRTRYELADQRLGHALDDLRSAVVAVAADRACIEADEKGCC